MIFKTNSGILFQEGDKARILYLNGTELIGEIHVTTHVTPLDEAYDEEELEYMEEMGELLEDPVIEHEIFIVDGISRERHYIGMHIGSDPEVNFNFLGIYDVDSFINISLDGHGQLYQNTKQKLDLLKES